MLYNIHYLWSMAETSSIIAFSKSTSSDSSTYYIKLEISDVSIPERKNPLFIAKKRQSKEYVFGSAIDKDLPIGKSTTVSGICPIKLNIRLKRLDGKKKYSIRKEIADVYRVYRIL